MLLPEGNARDLARLPSNPLSLPALLDGFVGEDLDTVLRSDVAFFEPMVRSGAVRNPSRTKEDSIVMILGDKTGKYLKVQKGPLPPSRNPQFKEMIEKRCAVEVWLFEMVRERRYMLLSLCAAVADEFRQEILGRNRLDVTMPTLACCVCGRAHMDGDTERPVQSCGRCAGAAYCSKACQRADWNGTSRSAPRASTRKKRRRRGGKGEVVHFT